MPNDRGMSEPLCPEIAAQRHLNTHRRELLYLLPLPIGARERVGGEFENDRI